MKLSAFQGFLALKQSLDLFLYYFLVIVACFGLLRFFFTRIKTFQHTESNYQFVFETHISQIARNTTRAKFTNFLGY